MYYDWMKSMSSCVMIILHLINEIIDYEGNGKATSNHRTVMQKFPKAAENQNIKTIFFLIIISSYCS